MSMIRIPTPAIECPALRALAVLAAESQFEFTPALAGGAVRNASNGYPDHGITDHDIAICGPDACNDDAITAMEVELEKLGYAEIARFEQSGEYADNQLWLVIKYEHPVFSDVDLLIHPIAANVRDVLDSFDFNINQYAMVIPDPLGDGEVETYYGGATNTDAIAANGGPLQDDFFHPEGQPPTAPIQVLLQVNPVNA